MKIVKKNKGNFYNVTSLLAILLLFGCGNTLKNTENTIQLINGNSVTTTTNEFKLTKLKDAAQFDDLPKELANSKSQMKKFDFYLAQSPTQNSGGFVFQSIQNSNPLKVCLKKPDQFSATTLALSNPIALIRVKKEMILEMRLGYCDQ